MVCDERRGRVLDLGMCGGIRCDTLRRVCGSAAPVLAIGGGLLAGLIVTKTDPFKQSLNAEMIYEDAPFWAEKEEGEE